MYYCAHIIIEAIIIYVVQRLYIDYEMSRCLFWLLEEQLHWDFCVGCTGSSSSGGMCSFRSVPLGTPSGSVLHADVTLLHLSC